MGGPQGPLPRKGPGLLRPGPLPRPGLLLRLGPLPTPAPPPRPQLLPTSGLLGPEPGPLPTVGPLSPGRGTPRLRAAATGRGVGPAAAMLRRAGRRPLRAEAGGAARMRLSPALRLRGRPSEGSAAAVPAGAAADMELLARRPGLLLAIMALSWLGGARAQGEERASWAGGAS